MDIDTNHIPQKNIEDAILQTNTIVKDQMEIADRINNGLQKIRDEIKKTDGKKRHRLVDFTVSWKKFISEIVSIYSKEHCEKEYKIGINNKAWEKLEFFLYTWESYFKILEIEKRRFDKNDWGDLFNLVYVQPGFKYWTLEKKWNTIFKENDRLSKYQFEK